MVAIAEQVEGVRPSSRRPRSPRAAHRPIASPPDSEEMCERLLASHLALLREIHDNVIQDLFGVALTLESVPETRRHELRDCAENVRRVLTELRSILDEATPEPTLQDPAPPHLPLVESLQGAAGEVYLKLGLDAINSAPAPVCSAVADFVNEGVRNALKHADPNYVSVNATFELGVLRVSVANDGARRGPSDRGVGLRLLSLDAQRLGGVLSVEHEEERWQLTLTLPVAKTS